MSDNIIEFIPLSKDAENVVPPPKPAKYYIPEWYKNIPAFNPKDIEFNNGGRVSNTSVKMCMPFLDSLTTGYIQETWTDIHFKEMKDGSVEFHYPAGPEIIRVREGSPSLPVDNSLYPIEFVWQEQWDVKTPNGWGVIYTHPFNSLAMPFISCTAVIDSDRFYHTATGQYPFFLKKGFEGIIPAGTPMYQIIPFKKDNWKSRVLEYDHISTLKRHHVMAKKLYGAYKELFWEKKKYN